jgi:hypothetical protein
VIDTLKLAKALETAGWPREQSEAVAQALAQAEEQLVTKKDLEIALSKLRWQLMLIIPTVTTLLVHFWKP